MKTTSILMSDVMSLNMMYLESIKIQSKINPIIAGRVFGIGEKNLTRIAHLSAKETTELAMCGKALMRMSEGSDTHETGLIKNTLCCEYEDIHCLNALYWTIAKTYCHLQSVEAVWVFGFNKQEIQEITKLTPNQIKNISLTKYPYLRINIHDQKRSHVGLGIRSVMTNEIK